MNIYSIIALKKRNAMARLSITCLALETTPPAPLGIESEGLRGND